MMAIIKERETPYTHDELVRLAAYWLEKTASNISMKCPLVIAELVTANTEIPDVIGFRYGVSILIECKASRGMGDNRYYFAPEGLISKAELPMYWGLIEINDTGYIKIVGEALTFPEANKHGEIIMLQSVIRRLRISTAVFVEIKKMEDEFINGTSDIKNPGGFLK
jgi:hypothetical protein